MYRKNSLNVSKVIHSGPMDRLKREAEQGCGGAGPASGCLPFRVAVRQLLLERYGKPENGA